MACDRGSGGDRPELPGLNHLVSSERVPASLVDDLALVSPREVCLIDSYRVRVVCGTRGWTSPRTLGSEGEGPGEYREPAAVVRGPGGAVGVLDHEVGRLTVFELDGGVRASVTVPPGFRPVGRPNDGVWPGTYLSPGDTVWSAPVAWLSLERDTVQRTAAFRHRSEAMNRAPPGAVPAAARSPDGTFVFWVGGDYTLVRFSEEGRFLGEFSSPSHEPELPTERDVQDFREDMRELFGRPRHGTGWKSSAASRNYLSCGGTRCSSTRRAGSGSPPRGTGWNGPTSISSATGTSSAASRSGIGFSPTTYSGRPWPCWSSGPSRTRPGCVRGTSTGTGSASSGTREQGPGSLPGGIRRGRRVAFAGPGPEG